MPDLRIIALENDLACLVALPRPRNDPTVAFGLTGGIGIAGVRSAVLRRYGLRLATMMTDAATLADIGKALAAHEEAAALMLGVGEFMGLLLNDWRNRHQIAHDGLPPLPYWHALDVLGLYSRTRAVKAKRRDDAQRIEAARLMLRDRYAGHREVAARDHMGGTVH